MLQHHILSDSHHQLILKPNRSLSWRNNKQMLVAMTIATLIVVTVFGALGAWPVIPFAVLVMLMLWSALYLTLLSGQDREVITIRDQQLLIQKGRYHPAQEICYPVHWTRLHKQHAGGYRDKLYLGCHGKRVEIGRFLNCEERKDLSARLLKLLPANIV